MPTISGNLILDINRDNIIQPTDTPLIGVPIVLRNTSTGLSLAVLTDGTGNYTFTNVPNGGYTITEAYGVFGAVASPADFSTAVAGPAPVGADPPIAFAINPPVGANAIDSMSPNTLNVTVSGSNLTNENFLDGPVIYTPITDILDPCSTIGNNNLINVADTGTFGTYPAGTPVNTAPPTEPYPGVTPGFTYTTSNGPPDGSYSIQNMIVFTGIGAWWSVSNVSTGDETGRFMVVNGANPGGIIFTDTVAVTPNTNYIFSSWVLNLIRLAGFVNPLFSVAILDQNGNVIYQQNLTNSLNYNPNAPNWLEIGTTVNSGSNTSLTVRFISQGPIAAGNDYAIDDVMFRVINIPEMIPVKSVNKALADIGDVVKYTITLTNTCSNTLTNVTFQDTVPEGLSFVSQSVTINGTPNLVVNPNTGFPVPDIPGGGTATITFEAKVDYVPSTGTTINNTATMSYNYTPVTGGVANSFTNVSNVASFNIILRDFGDAPDTSAGNGTNDYTTLLANNGPRHAVVSGLTLGTQITSELDAYQNATATGDDTVLGVQDDGLTLPIPTLLVGQSTYSLQVSYSNSIGLDANLYGWIDFNRDGIFQLNESSALATVPSSSTTNPRTATLNFTVPAGVTLVNGDYTFIRLRLTTENLINTNNNLTSVDTRSIGTAYDGEVEDYQIYIQSLNINGTVWYDTNCNGIRESGEPLAQGIVVELYNSSDLTTPIKFTTTDVNGNYSFNNLPEGNYVVKVNLPNGYNYTLANVGTNDLIDSDINKNTGMSNLLVLNRNNPTITVDSGLVRENKIAGQAFYDCTGDSILDFKDSYLCGVTVNLLDSNGVVIGSTITDCDGYYEFNNLCSGNYTVQTVAPPDMNIVAPNAVDYYGSKPVVATSSFTVTLNASDYLEGFIGVKGSSILDSKYCTSVPTCNKALTTDCSNYNYPNQCKDCDGSCAGCSENCNGQCLGCNSCPKSNRKSGVSCSKCNNENCGCGGN